MVTYQTRDCVILPDFEDQYLVVCKSTYAATAIVIGWFTVGRTLSFHGGSYWDTN